MFGWFKQDSPPRARFMTEHERLDNVYEYIDNLTDALNKKLDRKIEIEGGHLVDVETLLKVLAKSSNIHIAVD